MSNLDDKLRAIKLAWRDEHLTLGEIAQIKQAFADEGWMSRDDRFTIRDGNEDMYRKYGLMTGQEWYKRYKKLSDESVYDVVRKEFGESLAKKASGLDDH